MQAKKIQNIQGLRGLAVLLVVFAHLFLIEARYAKFEYVLSGLFSIGESGVDLFFLISGFVMVVVTRDSFQSRNKVLGFLYHRVTRIYPLYWFYSVLLLGVYLFQPSLISINDGNQINVLASFLLLPQNLFPLVAVGWTLIYEVYFYLVFAMLLLLPRKSLPLGLICWGAIIIVGNIYLMIDNPFFKVYFSPLAVEFIIGAFIGLLYYKQTIQGHAKAYVFAAFATWLGFYAIFRMTSEETVPSGWIRVLVFGLPAVLALYAALLYEKNNGGIAPKWLRSIGDASYSIYLSHILVLGGLGQLWSLFAVEGYLDNIVMLPLMFISVLYVGYMSFNVIEKRLLENTRAFERKLFWKRDKEKG